MSIYSINNPMSNAYGINVQSMKKKQEENTENILTDTLTKNTQHNIPTTMLTETEKALKEQKKQEEIQGSAQNNAELAVIVEQLAKEMGLTGKITYNALNTIGKKLEADFQATVKKGLADLGVAEDADFRLSLNEDKKITVSSNHKDKAKIEKFFKEHPELADSYQKIQTLNQVEEARKNSGTNLQDAYEKARLLSYSSSIMWGQGSAMAINGDGTLTSLLNTGFNLTI